MRTGDVNRRSKTIGVYKGGSRVAVYTTMSNAARALDVKVQNIFKALTGYKTKLKGYEFRYEQNETL